MGVLVEYLLSYEDLPLVEVADSVGGDIGLEVGQPNRNESPVLVVHVADADAEFEDALGGSDAVESYSLVDRQGDIHRYQNAEDIDRHEPLVDLSERGVRDVVKRTAKRAADETGDDDYRYVSSHDLRRRFAQRLLVDEQVNPRVVMQIGGWDSFAAIEPYLNAPTPAVVNEAFEDAGLS